VLKQLAIKTPANVQGAQIPQEDTPLVNRIAQGEVPSDLSSELCLSSAAGWLNKCLQEHPRCIAMQSQQTILPTRVVDVGSALKQPFLHVSGDNEHGKWVALSYFRGGNSDFTLTATSFSNLRKGLPLSDFPLTIRDAILVTRALGMQYLWVDALCIVQDDLNDWAHEASRMGDIYRHAVVTIAATSAESAFSGFLDKRERYFQCSIPWRRRPLSNDRLGGPDTHQIVIRQRDNPYYMIDTGGSHWATRGWTLQEELLSPRLLLYTTRRMLWQCCAGKSLEPKFDHYTSSELFSELKDIFQESSSPGNNAAKDSRFSSQTEIYDLWYRLLVQYSRRQLSQSKDCLPAIAGFAQYFQGLLQDQYWAGLWRRDILYGLLWTSRGVRNPAEDSTAVEFPSHNLGSSWSWVSVFSTRARWPRWTKVLKFDLITYNCYILQRHTACIYRPKTLHL
jgi:hypothetical protein